MFRIREAVEALTSTKATAVVDPDEHNGRATWAWVGVPTQEDGQGQFHLSLLLEVEGEITAEHFVGCRTPVEPFREASDHPLGWSAGEGLPPLQAWGLLIRCGRSAFEGWSKDEEEGERAATWAWVGDPERRYVLGRLRVDEVTLFPEFAYPLAGGAIEGTFRKEGSRERPTFVPRDEKSTKESDGEPVLVAERGDG